MAGLSQEQLKMLDGMDGIDQDLLATYKRNNAPNMAMPKGLATAAESVTGNKNTATNISSNSVVDEVGSLEAALNVAIDEGRKQRKDVALDFMNGVVPPGALPATSFASMLESFNSDARPLESSLINSATDFALKQMDLQKNNENSIRELALSVATETGDTTAAKMIAELAKSGDIDAAIQLSLQAYGEDYIRTENGIVKRGKKEGEDDTQVFSYNAGTQINDNPQAGEPRAGLFVGREDSFAEIPYVDYTKGSEFDAQRAMTKYISPQFAKKVADSFPADYTKLFLKEYIELTTATGQYQDPEQYLREFAAEYQLTIKEPKEEKAKEGEKEDDIYSVTGI